MWKNFVGRHGATGQLLHQAERVRPLQLVPVQRGVLAGLAHERVGITLERDVVVAGLADVLHPVEHHEPADKVERVLAEMEQDGIADEIALVVDGDELLRPVDLEVREAVHAGVAQQLQRVGARDEQVGHVVRLVEQRDRRCATRAARSASS